MSIFIHGAAVLLVILPQPECHPSRRRVSTAGGTFRVEAPASVNKTLEIVTPTGVIVRVRERIALTDVVALLRAARRQLLLPVVQLCLTSRSAQCYTTRSFPTATSASPV